MNVTVFHGRQEGAEALGFASLHIAKSLAPQRVASLCKIAASMKARISRMELFMALVKNNCLSNAREPT